MSPELAFFFWLVIIAFGVYSVWRPHRSKTTRTPSAEYETRVTNRYWFIAFSEYKTETFYIFASRRSNATRAAERKADYMFGDNLKDLKEV